MSRAMIGGASARATAWLGGSGLDVGVLAAADARAAQAEAAGPAPVGRAHPGGLTPFRRRVRGVGGSRSMLRTKG